MIWVIKKTVIAYSAVYSL